MVRTQALTGQPASTMFGLAMWRKTQYSDPAERGLQLDFTEVQRLAERVAGRIRDRLGIPSVSLLPRRYGFEPTHWRPLAGDDYTTLLLLASRIDHTQLRADATKADIWHLCAEARTFRFAAVCVNGVHVSTCRDLLAGCAVGICSVVGFPLGASASASKAFEARDAARAGATEIDMVLNVGALKDADYELVRDDIREVVRAARPARVKVIMETALLDDEQKIAACMLARVAGAHFVKTSTGFGPAGATTRDVALLRWTVDEALGVKASGGIRTRETALQLLQAGADRLGVSASVAIVGGDAPRAKR